MTECSCSQYSPKHKTVCLQHTHTHARTHAHAHTHKHTQAYVSALTILETLKRSPKTMFSSVPLNQLTTYAFWATAKFSPPSLWWRETKHHSMKEAILTIWMTVRSSLLPSQQDFSPPGDRDSGLISWLAFSDVFLTLNKIPYISSIYNMQSKAEW